jgi:hypothetical protein
MHFYIVRLDENIQFGCKIHIVVVGGKNYLQIFGCKFNMRKKLKVYRSYSDYFNFNTQNNTGNIKLRLILVTIDAVKNTMSIKRREFMYL